MPFDFTQAESREVRILREMEAFLSVPGNWCEGTMKRGHQRCVLGCLIDAEGIQPRGMDDIQGLLSQDGLRVLRRLSELIIAENPDWLGGPRDLIGPLWRLNDRRGLSAVQAAVRSALLSFEQETVHAV